MRGLSDEEAESATVAFAELLDKYGLEGGLKALSELCSASLKALGPCQHLIIVAQPIDGAEVTKALAAAGPDAKVNAHVHIAGNFPREVLAGMFRKLLEAAEAGLPLSHGDTMQ